MSRAYKIISRSESMALLSFEVRLVWTLGFLSEILKVPKKHLRTAFKLIHNPGLETEIMEKGKLVKRIFRYGFREFEIIKKGKRRRILAPHPDVQLVFRAISDWLESISSPHPNAFGFVKKRNPKQAAQALLENKHFIGFDIADAFPSITFDMVRAMLEELPIPVKEALVDVLAWLTTYDYDGARRLPQGSSCSPIILNLVYKAMCDQVQEVCQKYKVEWNVYADDFNFASRSISPEAKAELLAIPAKFGFSVKDKKTRDNAGRAIPHVLGLTIVDGEIHIGREAKNKIRRIIYAAKSSGAYSPEQVSGIVGYVRHIYGEEANWPGGILNVYRQYRQAGRRQ